MVANSVLSPLCISQKKKLSLWFCVLSFQNLVPLWNSCISVACLWYETNIKTAVKNSYPVNQIVHLTNGGKSLQAHKVLCYSAAAEEDEAPLSQQAFC